MTSEADAMGLAHRLIDRLVIHHGFGCVMSQMADAAKVVAAAILDAERSGYERALEDAAAYVETHYETDTCALETGFGEQPLPHSANKHMAAGIRALTEHTDGK